VLGQIVTSNHFTMLGIQPELGRLLVPSDDDPGSARVVVLSHQMWAREFGGRSDIVGQSLTLRGLSSTIVGVVPPAYSGVVPLLEPELFLPIAHVEEVEPAGINDSVPSPTGRTRLERRGMRWMFVKGRLKPGVTAEQAHANVAVIGAQLETAHPQTNKDRKLSAVATTKVRMLVPQASGPMTIGAAGVMSVVGLVLLIACANVAGMLLAPASARRREIGVRLAIGASRGRLVQQLLVEGLVLGALGAITAVGSAWMLIRALVSLELPLPVDLALDLRLDGRVLLFSIVVAAITGVLAGLIPALKASAPSLVSDLRDGAASARVAGRRWALRDGLVVLQVSLTAVLLVIAGLLLRSLGASERADVGFRTDGLALLSFDTDMVRYPPEKGEQFWTDVLARVRAMPGVQSAATSTPTIPFEFNFSQAELQVDNRTYADDRGGEVIENRAVSTGYFTTLGIRVVEGRDVLDSDRQGAPLVAWVNDTMAKRYWPNESAVGHSFRVKATRNVYQIAGVVANHKNHGVLESPAPLVHFATAQRPNRYNTIIARTSGDAAALVASMRRELLALEPSLVFMHNGTMEQGLARSLMPARIGALLATGVGGLGTLLAAIGLYGVIAFSVARRTREIGVRMALGAKPAGVLALVMRQGLTLVAIGLVAGGALAAAAAQVIKGLLFGVSPLDPVAWGLAIAAMITAAMIANLVPARRAMRVDPMTSLRTD
jgi:predicted permease